MNEAYLANNNKLVEFIVENDIDLIISLNQESVLDFNKNPTNVNLKSYKETLIEEESSPKHLIKKEINFKFDIYNVKF